MVKFKQLAGMLFICVFFTGCRDSYISNKNPLSLENSIVQDNSVDETMENSPQSFSMITNSLVQHMSKSSNALVNSRTEVMRVEDGINSNILTFSCQPDASMDWAEFPVRLYVIDNGNPIMFSVGDAEPDIFQDVTCIANEQMVYEIRYDQSELCSSSGKIDVLIIYNPEALPGLGITSFQGVDNYYFYYYNEGYSGEKINDIQSVDGEYLDIPEEYRENAYVEEIGPKEIYTDRFTPKNIHYYEDIEVNSISELYVHINTGENNPGDEVMGIICDGKLMQFHDGSYFKSFNSDYGQKTLQYQMAEFENVDPGLHYFQIVHMSLETVEDKDNATREVSYRYRIVIKGDNK
ncbi:MAG: hypothetical protein ACI4EN_08235 [Butyrivibrio sp.]